MYFCFCCSFFFPLNSSSSWYSLTCLLFLSSFDFVLQLFSNASNSLFSSYFSIQLLFFLKCPRIFTNDFEQYLQSTLSFPSDFIFWDFEFNSLPELISTSSFDITFSWSEFSASSISSPELITSFGSFSLFSTSSSMSSSELSSSEFTPSELTSSEETPLSSSSSSSGFISSSDSKIKNPFSSKVMTFSP